MLRCLGDGVVNSPGSFWRMWEDKLLPFPAGSKVFQCLSSGNAYGNNCPWTISAFLCAGRGLSKWLHKTSYLAQRSGTNSVSPKCTMPDPNTRYSKKGGMHTVFLSSINLMYHLIQHFIFFWAKGGMNNTCWRWNCCYVMKRTGLAVESIHSSSCLLGLPPSTSTSTIAFQFTGNICFQI